MIKYLLLGLFVVLAGVSTPARAATTDVAVEWCDFLGTIAYEIGWCYPELTVNNATAVTSNSAQVIVDTDRSNKGIIYTLATTSCTNKPSVASMLAAQQTVVSGANNTVAISGLTPSTNGYCVWAMQEWDRRYSDIFKTASTFNTIAGSTPPTDEDPAQGSTAPVYYVSKEAGCSNSNNGTSPATPWCTASKVNSTVSATSAKVYFRGGDTWQNDPVYIDWSGTLSDPVIVGSYKMVSGSPKIANSNNGDARARFIGNITDTCITNKNCPYNANPEGYLPEQEIGWIYSKADYFIIQDLEVAYQRLIGIMVDGEVPFVAGSLKYFKVQRNYIHHGGETPFIAYNGVQKGVVRDNIAHDNGLCVHQGTSGGLQTKSFCTYGNGWGGGYAISRSPDADVLFENNLIYRNFGETYNAYNRTTHVVFRNNWGGNAHSGGFYIDAAQDIVVEGNVIWGVQGNTGYPTTANFGGPVCAFNIESIVAYSYGYTGGLCRNNISIDAGAGIEVGLETLSQQNGNKIRFKGYNNLLLSSANNGMYFEATSNNVDYLDIRANIVYTPDAVSSTCVFHGTLGNAAGVNFAYNIFSSNGLSPRCTSQPLFKTQAPVFAVNRPYSFWDTVDYTNYNQIKYTDFKPVPGSPQAGYGDPTLATTVCLDTSKFSYALANMKTGFIPDPEVWKYCRAYDIDGDIAHPTAPSAGPQELN